VGGGGVRWVGVAGGRGAGVVWGLGGGGGGWRGVGGEWGGVGGGSAVAGRARIGARALRPDIEKAAAAIQAIEQPPAEMR